MSNEIKGKIISVLPIQEGTGKSGKAWMKQGFILETLGQYPKKVCFPLLNEQKINDYDLQAGLECTVHFELESREHSGRWYTEARAWKVEWTSDQRRWNSADDKPTKQPLQSVNQRDDQNLPF